MCGLYFHYSYKLSIEEDAVHLIIITSYLGSQLLSLRDGPTSQPNVLVDNKDPCVQTQSRGVKPAQNWSGLGHMTENGCQDPHTHSPSF